MRIETERPPVTWLALQLVSIIGTPPDLYVLVKGHKVGLGNDDLPSSVELQWKSVDDFVQFRDIWNRTILGLNLR